MSPALPIDEILPAVVADAAPGARLVVAAPPGAGKTTALPPALLDCVRGTVVVTQPRRLAARLSARHVANRRGEALGATIGYHVRFDRQAAAGTRLLYATEGILLRQLAGDPTLPGVGALVLDEFHERHLSGDLLLSWARQLQDGPRPDLMLVVMSATLDVDAVAAYLPGARVHVSAGRGFPVEVAYVPDERGRPLERRVAGAVRTALEETAGDVLVFLPGAGEILRTAGACRALAAEQGADVRPLYGALPLAEQDRAVQPGPRRKVILSTNVAETSLTIPGVRVVIDGGLVRRAQVAPWSGLPRFTTGQISQAAAAQRAGRAGRTAPGRCWRLYREHDLQTAPAYEPAEIAGADLSEALLWLHGLDVDPDAFAWFEAPPPAALAAGAALLRSLGAVDAGGALTDIGRRLGSLPLHPRLGRVALAAADAGVGGPGATVAAALAELDGPRGGRADAPPGPSDALAQAAAAAAALDRGGRGGAAGGLDAAAVAAVGRSRAALLAALALPASAPAAIAVEAEPALLQALLLGFADRLARRREPHGDVWLLSGGGTVRQDERSVVRGAELAVVLAAEEHVRGTRRQRIARSLSAVDADWLLDLLPERLHDEREVVWDEAAGRAWTVARLRFDELVLSESRRPPAPADAPAAAALLTAAALRHGLERLLDGGALANLRARLDLAARVAPDRDWPALDEAALGAQLRAACSGLSTLAELRQAGLERLLHAQLGDEVLRALDRLAPTHVQLPGGRRLPVHYAAGQDPWVASYLQDFLGMQQTPTVAGGRAPLVVHLWAPNRRAVQVSQDLAGFWQQHYPKLRTQLMRRYPKHHWPEDPSRPGPRLKSGRD